MSRPSAVKWHQKGHQSHHSVIQSGIPSNWPGSEGKPRMVWVGRDLQGHQSNYVTFILDFQLFHYHEDGLLLRECWAQVQESTGWGWTVTPSLSWLCAGNRKLSPSWFFLPFVPLPIALCMWQHYIHRLRVTVPSILMLW